MIITVLKIVFLLGFLIVLHEFAHYIVAKLSGVKVIEFSIGFGKSILKKVHNGTVYTLRLVPLGGYVNLKGLDEKNTDFDSYTSVNIWKRMAIILAGSVMNIIFALIVFFILVGCVYGFKDAIPATGKFLFSAFDSLRMLFTGQVGVDQFMGPIGISNMVSETKLLADFVYLLAVISLSLGITNLLPIPPLDGFKFWLLIIEGIRRKPFSQNFEYAMQFIGFFFLLGVSVFVAYNDIIRIV